MANTLSKTGISDSSTIEASHISQSIDALAGLAAYDITISGSLTLTGSVQSLSGYTGSLQGTASFAQTASYAQNAIVPSTVISSAQTSSVTGSSAETILYSELVSSNTFNTDDILTYNTRVFFDNIFGGTTNSALRLYINNTGSLDGNEYQIAGISINNPAGTNYVNATRTLLVDNQTTNTYWLVDGSADESVISTSAIYDSGSIDWSADQYAIVTVQPGEVGYQAIGKGVYIKK